MKVKVKKVKHTFVKEPEDVKMTLSQFAEKSCLLCSKRIPIGNEKYRDDIQSSNHSSEWVNFTETTNRNCDLIGPLPFESFFDENNDFSINEIGAFIFSSGFDEFIFIEKTLKCMWHFQSVSDDKIILENEFSETYVCHDWKTFCTTVLPGVYTMYNITDSNGENNKNAE